jgi:hypothetical protein
MRKHNPMYKHLYYQVEAPKDAFKDVHEAGYYAIHEAEERAKTWAAPATWTATLVRETGDNYIFRVRRTTRRP